MPVETTPATEAIATSPPAPEAITTSSPAADLEEIEEVEIEGVVLSATVQVQCLSCGAQLEAPCVSSDPADRLNMDAYAVECLTCSAAVSKLEGKPLRAMIPLALLAGFQVDLALPDGRLPFLDENGVLHPPGDRDE